MNYWKQTSIYITKSNRFLIPVTMSYISNIIDGLISWPDEYAAVIITLYIILIKLPLSLHLRGDPRYYNVLKQLLHMLQLTDVKYTHILLRSYQAKLLLYIPHLELWSLITSSPFSISSELLFSPFLTISYILLLVVSIQNKKQWNKEKYQLIIPLGYKFNIVI